MMEVFAVSPPACIEIKPGYTTACVLLRKGHHCWWWLGRVLLQNGKISYFLIISLVLSFKHYSRIP